MKTFIKIYGPPYLKAITELEKIAIDMPEICIMDEGIAHDIPQYIARDIGGETFQYDAGAIDSISGFFMKRTGVKVPVERCHTIISNSGESLGDFDFFFEWFEDPDMLQVKNLIEKIDKALTPVGCHYTLITR